MSRPMSRRSSLSVILREALSTVLNESVVLRLRFRTISSLYWYDLLLFLGL